MYAARLATALKQRLDVAIFGMGGPHMRAAGVEIITDYSEVSVMGITEVLKRLPSLFRATGTDCTGRTKTAALPMSLKKPDWPTRETATTVWEWRSATTTMTASPICT